MNLVENFFKAKTDEIAFLELKEDQKIKNITIESNLPLPVITDQLVKDIQVNHDQLNLANVIDGMIYLIGLDKDFKHVDKYKDILVNYTANITDYIFDKGMIYLENKDLLNSGIFFRTLIFLEKNNIKARFNYAIVLEELSREFILNDKFDEGNEFLQSSTNELEKITQIDKSFSLAYYKLGFHYKYRQEFLKASITWGKFLTLDKDANRLQEIREELNIIDDDVKFETGLTYLSYRDYNKALDALLKLLPKHEENWNVNYLIAKCYRGLNDDYTAIEYLEYAIELNKTESDLYNELGLIFFNTRDIENAIRVYSEGITNIKDDYKLYFNRGLIYLQLEQYDLALDDINTAYRLNPNDENIALQKRELDKIIKS